MGRQLPQIDLMRSESQMTRLADVWSMHVQSEIEKFHQLLKAVQGHASRPFI